ncbi:DUF4377 domain-containing protein [Aequorivita capsosiphonis]|uniref:DUF4377 domain-containing protein n=1 Tax=Aequorivita capsosiphonis TaxID=487317 RepID=UPI0004141C9D|nr:DUF4377 domain-containing protein [Aequorivita capsosiphonis]
MKLLLAFFISAIALNTCENDSTEKLAGTIFFVNSSRADCTGVGPMKCFQTQESDTLDPEGWQLFYAGIEGFSYQPGYIYKLLIKKEKLDPATVPADASSIKYTLVKVLEKNKDKKFLLDDIWKVTSIQGEKIEIPETTNPNQDNDLVLAIDLLEMKTLGYNGCNNFHGTIETSDNNSVTFKITGATKMMCPNMELPSNYKSALEKAKTYKMEDLQLYFYDAEGNEVLKFQKAD